MSKLKKITVGIMILLLLSAGTGFIYARHYTDKYFAPPSEITLVDDLSSAKEKQVAAASPLNILVVGVDDKANKDSRNKTIMVYHINPANRSIGLLAIPRDTYMNIPGQGTDKINNAYNNGGIKLSREAIENFLGIDIDYYMETDFSGFSKLIDQVGGINVMADYDLRGTNIKKGQHRLNGTDALNYVRAGDGTAGELDQIKRQQRYIKALANQVSIYKAKWQLAMEIPDLYKNIQTNLPLETASELYRALRFVNKDTVRIEVVPGVTDNSQGINYWKPDNVKTHELVTKIFIEPDVNF